MSFALEYKKMKRTGFHLTFLCGGFVAALVPILNMAVRSKNYIRLDASPVQILMNANWQMMAILNILLVLSGACLMYHTEYADNAILRMRTLPMKESSIFLGKAAFMAVMCVVLLSIEAAGVAFCSYHWYKLSAHLWMELMKSFGYALLLLLPTAFGSLWIASACKNMWVSLGIGVVCVFTATILPVENFALSLFPFALPFQMLAGTSKNICCNYMVAAGIEVLILGIAELLFIKVRRSFE